jgi:isopenicillin N synthase-like dioxygenase
MQAVPIDLEPFRLGDDADKQHVARLLDLAARESGFFSISGHGIPRHLIERMLRVTSAFFDLPAAAKMQYFVADRQANRGYAPEGSEALAYSLGEADLPPDLFEAFNVGVEIAPGDVDDYVRAGKTRFFADNVWPTEIPEFQDVWLEYWAAAEQLGLTVMRAAAVALGLDEKWFDPSLDRGIHVMRANNYRRQPGALPPLANQMRMGAHTDYGSITVLLADPVPGLQIRDDAGAWFDVIPPDDGFIVNIGDLLAEWTNDRWRSTMHRVVPPPPDVDGSAHRRSVAWFQQPNWDAEIRCLPTCTSADDPPRYQPVRSGDHLLAKLMGPRLLRPSETTPVINGD